MKIQSHLMTLAVSIALATSGAMAHAEARGGGAGHSGGGHGYDNSRGTFSLADLASYEGLVPKTLDQISGFSESKKIHSFVEARIPGFAQKLRDALKRKRIFLVTDPQRDLTCPYKGLEEADAKPIACQSSVEVRIKESLFMNLGGDTDRGDFMRGLLIVHEQVRAEAERLRLDDGAILSLIATLAQEVQSTSPLSQSALRDEVARLGFGYYHTAEHLRAVESEVRQTRAKLQKAVNDYKAMVCQDIINKEAAENRIGIFGRHFRDLWSRIEGLDKGLLLDRLYLIINSASDVRSQVGTLHWRDFFERNWQNDSYARAQRQLRMDACADSKRWIID